MHKLSDRFAQVSLCTNYVEVDGYQGWAPRPAPPREKRAAPPRKKASLAPPRENWQNLGGGAGQSLFESLEN